MVIVFNLHASVLFTSGWDHKRLPSQEVWEVRWPCCQCARLQVERSGFEGQGHCVAFLGKTLDSRSASLHPEVEMGTDEFNAGLAYNPGVVEIALHATETSLMGHLACLQT